MLAPSLRADLRSLLQSLVAPSTFRLYSKAWLRFTGWLESEGPGSIDDLDDHAFARWLSALFDDGLAPAFILSYSAGVKFILKLAGHPSPAGTVSHKEFSDIRNIPAIRSMCGLYIKTKCTDANRRNGETTGFPTWDRIY